MPKTLVIAVLAGAASGVLFIAPMSGSLLGMLLINFTHLPLFLVGLGLGTAAAGVAAATGSVIVGVAAGLGPVVSFAVAFAVPVVLAARQALQWRTLADGSIEWYPPGRVLTLLVCYGALTFGIMYLAMAGRGEGLVAVVREMLAETFALLAPELGDEKRMAAADQWASLLPAALVMSWLFTIAINAALAQGVLARMGRNSRPSLDLSRIELPLGFAFALVASGALWFFAEGDAGFLGQTLTIVVAAPYLFVGLAVVHRVSRGWPGRPFGLTMFYLVLLFLLGLPGLALVAVLGLAEQLFGLRRRFAGPAPDKEDE